jgi:hypothetical protein
VREIRLHGSEGGGIEINRSSLPLSKDLASGARSFRNPATPFRSDKANDLWEVAHVIVSLFVSAFLLTMRLGSFRQRYLLSGASFSPTRTKSSR